MLKNGLFPKMYVSLREAAGQQMLRALVNEIPAQVTKTQDGLRTARRYLKCQHSELDAQTWLPFWRTDRLRKVLDGKLTPFFHLSRRNAPCRLGCTESEVKLNTPGTRIV